MAQTSVNLTSPVDDELLSHRQAPQQPQDEVASQGYEIIEENLSNQHQPHQQQQHEINNVPPVTSQAGTPQVLKPNPELVNGPREHYLKIGVPLYEASIRCNWKAAIAILDKYPKLDLVRYSITENLETALHVAASAKGNPKDIKEFVSNLVAKMEKEDLALQNNNFNTALYLAAAAGNIEAIKIMVKKNNILLTICGGKTRNMSPLYAAVLFGHYDAAKYLYEKTNELCDARGWNAEHQDWLLQKCVENDMFDIALEIVKKYPELCSGDVLAVLARKPEAFNEPRSNIVKKAVKLSKYLYSSMSIKLQPSEDKNQEPGDHGSAPEDKHPEPAAGNGSAPEADMGSAPEDDHPETSYRSAPEVKHSAEADNGINAPENEQPEAGNGSSPEAYIGSAPEDDHQPLQNEDLEVGSSRSGPVDLSQKHEPFPETKSSIINSVSAFIGIKGRSHGKENYAMQLLRIVWGNIAKKSKKDIDDIIRGPADVKQDDKPASEIVNQTLKLQKLISERIVSMHVEIQNIIRDRAATGKEDQALQLQKLISEHIAKMHVETQNVIKGPITTSNHQNVTSLGNTKKTYSSRILFVAAEMGNITFVVELIRQYPDLIWKVNDNDQSIFHIAVKHRHEGIYNLLYEIGSMKDLITPLKDKKDNNMLHLVGKSAKQKRLEDVSGVALQMQRELLWFKEVEAMIPPSYREKKNKDGYTPYELFTKEHKELVAQGEKWMKGTASQCMVVAALIATIVFAAAFTVPGGYDQSNDKTNGIPVFHSKATFMIFVVADAISLFTSSTSILMFLSILTSRYAERDFLESLPTKLMLGLVTLFLSIITMTVAFSVSFFVLYHKGLLWMPIIISVFAMLPVLLYMVLQYGLFIDVIRSTYGSRYLFKPQKHVLYYKN